MLSFCSTPSTKRAKKLDLEFLDDSEQHEKIKSKT
jgi:hypothetical protein